MKTEKLQFKNTETYNGAGTFYRNDAASSFVYNVSLPLNNIGEKYVFGKYYNISNQNLNAIFIYMEIEPIDNGLGLKPEPQTNQEAISETYITELIDVTGSEKFDISKDKCLVIIFHDVCRDRTQANLQYFLININQYYEEAIANEYSVTEGFTAPKKHGIGLLSIKQ